MTNRTRNEAAEKLLPRISVLTHGKSPMYVEMRDLFDAALGTAERESGKWGALEALARVNERVLEAYTNMRPDQEWIFVVTSILRDEAEKQADARISAFEAEAAEPAPCPVCEGWGAYCDEHRPSYQSVDFVREERS